jgi:hypothetical protein
LALPLISIWAGKSCGDRREGWVFQSRYKGKHIGAAYINRQWVKARKAAKLPDDLVLYCARHDFGTYAHILRFPQCAVNLSRPSQSPIPDVIGHRDLHIGVSHRIHNSFHISCFRMT